MDSLGSRKEELKSKIKEFEEIYLKIDGLIREVNKLTEELKKM
jgi:hypothetical protein